MYRNVNNINFSFLKQVFQLREVRTQYKLNASVPRANQFNYWKKLLRYYNIKFGTPIRFISNLMKILNSSKALLKIRMVVHVIVIRIVVHVIVIQMVVHEIVIRMVVHVIVIRMVVHVIVIRIVVHVIVIRMAVRVIVI